MLVKLQYYCPIRLCLEKTKTSLIKIVLVFRLFFVLIKYDIHDFLMLWGVED